MPKYAKEEIMSSWNKIVDKDDRHPSSKELLFQNGNGAQANEELVCIPLHFFNAKE